MNVKINNKTLKENIINSKIALLFVLQWFLLLSVIIINIFSWNNKWKNSALYLVPEHIQIIRCISLFVMSWYVFISLVIWNTYDTYKINNKNKLISLFSFTFIALIYLSWKYFVFLKWDNIQKNIKDIFQDDDSKKIQRKSFIYIFSIIIFCIFIVVVPLLAFYTSKNNEISIWIPNVSEPLKWNDLWFNSLQFFTIQSNFLCLVVLILFVINPNMKIFKNRILLIIATINITIVCFVYNFILLPDQIITKEIKNWDLQKYLSLAFNHIFNPIVFVVFFSILNTKHKNKIELKFKNFLIATIFLPTIYITYVISQPFVSNTSVYGFATNLNPNVLTNLNTPGNPINIAYIILIYLLFYGLSAFVYFINNKLVIRKVQYEK